LKLNSISFLQYIHFIADQYDNDNDLYLFLLPSGNQCYFTDEDIIKESDSLVLTSSTYYDRLFSYSITTKEKGDSNMMNPSQKVLIETIKEALNNGGIGSNESVTISIDFIDPNIGKVIVNAKSSFDTEWKFNVTEINRSIV
jgi:hypothetical protein